MYLQLKEELAKYEAEHGQYVVDGDNETIWYEDGAYRDRDPRGVWAGVPEDDQQRHRNIIHYHKLRLKLASDEFYTAKNRIKNIIEHAEKAGVTPPDESIFKELQKLKDKVEERKKALEEAKQAQAGAIPESVKEAERQREKNRMKATELSAQLSKFKI